MLKAVIFDMDGVIIDSEPMHARAAILALKKFNVNVSMKYLQGYIGSTTDYMCQKMIEDFHLDTTPEELLRLNNEMKAYLLKQEGHTVVPYITDLIIDLYHNGMKLIIASSSPSEAIEEVMESLKIKNYFIGYVSGTSLSKPKPAPDIFLKASQKLGIDPEDCIVIEDSFHGVTAACAAGMTCIGYVNPNSGNQDLSKASFLIEGFDEVDFKFIHQVYQQDHCPATILTSDRFIIRELAVSDIPRLFEIYQQPQIKEYIDNIEDNLENEIEKHKAYIHYIYHFYGFGLWGVFLKESGLLIGRSGIEQKVLDGEEVIELGYLLDSTYQGLGYAKEFVSEIIHYCFTELDIRRIVAIIDKNNKRSCHLAEQVGMKRYGECIREGHDSYKYEIIYHK